MLQHKVPVVFGSDWATSPLSPLTQINDAVFRESPFGLGDGPWHPEQAVTFDEALFAYTQAGANMTPWADQIGSISTGKWADFVVLDAKLPDPVDRSIRKRHVEATYVAGTEVYRAK
ncbi:amidohydrolase family protein [Ensifer sp. HO-A22]|nr:amidohydrolase family protein [Ensifer oleiphilus]